GGTASGTEAATSWVSGGRRKREADCSRPSSRGRPSNCETAAFASRILPRRSQTKTGSGAFATMTSAASVLRTLSSIGEFRPTLPKATKGKVLIRLGARVPAAGRPFARPAAHHGRRATATIEEQA